MGKIGQHKDPFESKPDHTGNCTTPFSGLREAIEDASGQPGLVVKDRYRPSFWDKARWLVLDKLIPTMTSMAIIAAAIKYLWGL
jgi:hypothetical protein